MNVQVLRGIAALSVVFYHIGQRLPRYTDFHTHLAFLEFGRAGVDLFFVISGFIMVYITSGAARGDVTWRDFLENRCTRILPLYWLVSTVVLVVFLAKPSLVNSSSGTSNILLSYILIPNQNYFLLSLGWTLSHEFFFYIVFAVCGGLIGFTRGPHLAAGMLAVVVLIGWIWQPVGHPILRTVTASVNLGFIYGIGLALLSRSAWRMPLAWFSIGLGVSIFAVYPFFPVMLGSGPIKFLAQ